MHHTSDSFPRNDHSSLLGRLGEQALAYLQTRTAEHWIMFLAGIIIGLILG